MPEYSPRSISVNGGKWNIPEEGCDEENGMKANGGNNNGKI